MSSLKQLEETTITNIRTTLNASYLQGADVNGFDAVLTRNIFKVILDSLSTSSGNVDYSEIDSAYGFEISSAGGGTRQFSALLTIIKHSGLGWADLFNDSASGSFYELGNAKELLVKLSGMFLAYPILTFDPATEQHSLTLKLRNTGTIRTSSDLGKLKSSLQRTFYGYNAIAARRIPGYYTSDDRYTSPANIGEEQFNLLPQKFDFINYSSLLNIDGYPASIHTTAICGAKASPFVYFPIDIIHDGADSYTTYTQFLLNNFVRFWGSQDIDGNIQTRTMYERIYSGVGIGNNPLNILDRLSINGNNYTVIETRRNLLTNETTVKAVQYN